MNPNNRRPFHRGPARVRREHYTDSRPDPTQQDAEAARTRPAGDGLSWKKIDLHLHTPASSDYRDPGISYLDILKKAEEKGLDMIAFADHNTVTGYAAMHQEIETLSLLERLGRISDVEQATLNEYRRLLKKITVLPAFEFTATFGFHILGVFPEGTSVRKLEYLLLNLNVPEERMLRGAPDVGSTSDVLTAYLTITQAGGMAMAAHANSSNGVAMQGFPFGGQTKIAYTQDQNLICLEVTDMEQTSRRTTAGFYNGTKTEYPRRMHCIQGSDAHSLNTEQADANNKRLGVGARITEVLVAEASFAGLKEVLTGEDFTRIRPYRANVAWERIEAGRVRGSNQITAFHERALHPTLRTRHIMQDVVAFANGYGGIIYVGAVADSKVPLAGIERPEEMVRLLREEVHKSVEPELEVSFDIKPGGPDRGIIVMNVPGGDNRPYLFAPSSQIYVRDGGTSVLPTRDEMIKLIVDATKARGEYGAVAGTEAPPKAAEVANAPQRAQEVQQPQRAQRDRSPVRMQAQTQQQPEPVETPSTQPQQEARREPAIEVPARASLPVSTPRTLPGERLAAQAKPAEAQPEQAATPVPAPERPAATTPQVRRPNLHELPPERIKGQVRPMLPKEQATAQEGAPAPEASFGARAISADEVAPEIEQALVQESRESGIESLPTQPEMVIDGVVQSATGVETVAPARGDRRRRRPGQPVPETAVESEQPAAMEVEQKQLPVASEQAVELAQEKPARRSRRRGAANVEVEQPVETPPEAPLVEIPQPDQSDSPALEVAAPMEATVSSEHLSREELVDAEAEKPSGRRGRSRSGRSKQQERTLEIDAPTAAAAATEAGTEAILVEAEVEPGAQIPGEIPAEAPAEETSRRGRPRRTSAATKAAEQEAGIGTAEAAETSTVSPQEVRPAQLVPEAAATEPSTGRRRRGKRGAATEETATEEAMPAGTPQAEPPTPPSTGVEIVDAQGTGRAASYTMRDLRNGQTVRNVTKQSARRLWHYAITQHERGNPALAEVLWHNTQPIGLWRRDERAGAVRYDLVSRYPDGSMRVFYGVTGDGLPAQWRDLVDKAEAAGYTGPDIME